MAFAGLESMLKEQLRETVKIILDSNDYTLENLDDAKTILSSMKDFKCATALDNVPVPPEFRCPLSGKLMADPVILSTGRTYDKPFIEKWLKEGHNFCPLTREALSNSILIPNRLVQRMISQWRKDHGFDEIPMPIGIVDGEGSTKDKEEVTDEETERLHSLLLNLTLSHSDQKEAAKELRQLSKTKASFRAIFGKPDLIQQLLRPLLASGAPMDPELHEDLITTVHNISIHADNKRLLAKNETVISCLVESLKPAGTQTTIHARANAAAAIFSLSSVYSNKRIIGRSGAIRYLVDLLEEGHPVAMKDAAHALFNLCLTSGNRERTTREGGVQVIMNKIAERKLVDEMLSLLALLSSHSKATEALSNHGAVKFVLGIMKGLPEASKENCVAILHAICFSDETKLKEIEDNEAANHTLFKVSQSGTERAKRKANAILHKIQKPSSSNPAT